MENFVRYYSKIIIFGQSRVAVKYKGTIKIQLNFENILPCYNKQVRYSSHFLGHSVAKKLLDLSEFPEEVQNAHSEGRFLV